MSHDTKTNELQKKEIKFIANKKQACLSIRQFTLDMMVPHGAIVMIAKRGSGKSWIVRAILDFYRDIPVGIIISPTDRMNSYYADFFPDSYIYYEYKSETIERIMSRQQMIIDKAKEKEKIGKKIDTRSYVVMDDCLGQKGKWVRDPPIQEMLFNGRHYHIMYILTMQQPLGITPELRNNFDYVFLLANDKLVEMKKIWEHYAGIFPTFYSFQQVFSELTADYGSMVISNRGANITFEHKVFYYKAPNLANTKSLMGCKQFRDYHTNNFNDNWRIHGKKFNAIEFMEKRGKSKGKIAIEKVGTYQQKK